MIVELEEIELCGDLVCVKADVNVELYGREFAEFEGRGRVCTFGGSATVVDAEPLAIVEGVERQLTDEEKREWNEAFWLWLNPDRETWLQEMAWAQ